MQAFQKKLPVSVQVALKYGFFSSLLLAVLLTVLYYADRHPLLIPVIYDVRIFLLAIFIFFAVKEFRDLRNGGVLHFWQGMLMGLTLAVTLGFLAAVFIMIFGTVEEEFLSSYTQLLTDQLVNNRQQYLESVGEEAYQNTLRSLPGTSLNDLALDYYLKTVVIGVFLTIIISVILRRQTITKP